MSSTRDGQDAGAQSTTTLLAPADDDRIGSCLAPIIIRLFAHWVIPSPLLIAASAVSSSGKPSPDIRGKDRMTRADIGRVEIPQRSSLLPYRGVLSFRSEARRYQAVKRREFITLLGGAAARGRSPRARSRASACGASA